MSFLLINNVEAEPQHGAVGRGSMALPAISKSFTRDENSHLSDSTKGSRPGYFSFFSSFLPTEAIKNFLCVKLK